MNDVLEAVVAGGPPCQGLSKPIRRKIRKPRLALWSINQAESNDLAGQERHDFERELRISALGNLLCSSSATPLWRRVCCREMNRELRARSTDQCLAMELALLEATR